MRSLQYSLSKGSNTRALATLLIALAMTPDAIAQDTEQTCGDEARATGTLTTDRGNITFNSTPAKIRAIHCLDVDSFDQAGCISAYEVEIGEQQGCRVRFQLSRSANKNAFAVSSFGMTTDSLCPGWKDEHEDTYELKRSNLTATGPLQVPEGHGDRATTCFKATVKIKGSMRMRAGFASQSLETHINGLIMKGSIGSKGLVNRPCLNKIIPRPRPRPRPKTKYKPKPRPKPKQPGSLERREYRWDFGISSTTLTPDEVLFESVAIMASSPIESLGMRIQYSYTPLPPNLPLSFHLDASYEKGSGKGPGDGSQLTHSLVSAGAGYLFSFKRRFEFHPRVSVVANYRGLQLDDKAIANTTNRSGLNVDMSGFSVGLELGFTTRLRISHILAAHLGYGLTIANGSPVLESPSGDNLQLLEGNFSRIDAGITCMF